MLLFQTLAPMYLAVFFDRIIVSKKIKSSLKHLIFKKIAVASRSLAFPEFRWREAGIFFEHPGKIIWLQANAVGDL